MKASSKEKHPVDSASTSDSHNTSKSDHPSDVRPATATGSIVSDEKEPISEAGRDLESGQAAAEENNKQPVLEGKKMLGVMVALALSMFLAALDNTIVSTMLPKISEEFEALNLMTWIITSYVIASTALQPIYGKLCQIYGHQYVLLAAHVFFLVGSIICGASKSAHMLIAGRTVAGVGGSGLMSICFVVVGDFVPAAKGPMYLASFGMVWAISSVVGPLLGGVFADKTGFEWGFYINPCIQAAVLVLIVLFMRIPRPQGSPMQKLKRIDFIGVIVIVAGIVLLQLGLTWGGRDHPWKSAAVIVTLVLGIILLAAFVFIEWKLPTEPIMPLRLFKRRNTCLMFAAQGTFGITFFMPIFYIPIYLSVIKNVSAISAGVHLISCMLGISLASICTGILITKTGIYRPFIWIGTVLNVTGIGLFTLFDSHPSEGKLIGIPIIFGVGIGVSMQPMISCMQNSVDQRDVATSTTLFMTIRMLGNAIGLAIAQSVLQNQISPLLDSIATKFPDYTDVIYGIITDQSVIWGNDVPPKVRDATIDAYVKALRKVYLVILAFGVLTFIISLFVKNVSLRKKLGDDPEDSED
ncbi:hypothetical protein H4R20_005170 [Coemansia guatemalensis]|uniref:Major facilitator superfamily (MFS) profile domain-containing protein n=1 Tax=Coemansia guatemalensis TaxID=2761395 RepID=A0A9W8HT93_9FUNG|nr:hypothetical protein H4R20_005170 [Coemansia guatemalensis]